MRKVIGGFLAILILLAGMVWVSKAYFFCIGYSQPLVTDAQGMAYTAKVEGKDFYVLDEQGEWQKTFLAGVDIGLGVPGAFPGEFAIGYETYFDWFTQIGEMGSNVIRVYTPQTPGFYRALYDYNRAAATPLYLMQGVYMDENDVLTYGDVFAEGSITIADMRQDIVDCINMLHGNAVVAAKPGKASGVYQYDVSPYVIGWILGIECEAYLVEGTNQAHPELTTYTGTYLYTENASPFEVFIAEVTDLAITYEAEHYQMQRPVAFSNWITTDPLSHPNEPRATEDTATIDVEHIRGTAAFTPGFFASYHVYPYYPDFLNFPSGDPAVDQNTYLAYVASLVAYHSMPVLISEFGLPTSRGVTHINHLSGLNQGGNSQQQQAAALVSMLTDIRNAGCMGGVVFAWQDEWFKTSWNTTDFDNHETRPKWHNVESSEENFGIISFSALPSITIDGDDGDWKDAEAVGSLKVAYDESYLYLRVPAEQWDSRVYCVPIDTIAGQGSGDYLGMRFDRDADFVLVIDGEDGTQLLVDPYYDANYTLYGALLFPDSELARYAASGSGMFQVFRQVICSELLMPQTGQVVPIQFWETGNLRYGTSNPKDPAFDSLADFCAGDGFVELRIPWMLLNFADPSSGEILGNLHTPDGIHIETIQSIALGVGRAGAPADVAMAEYTLPSWGALTYTQSEKLAYAALQTAFPQFATYPITSPEALSAAMKLRDTRMLYVRLDRSMRKTDVITYLFIFSILLAIYLYTLLLLINLRLNGLYKRQERERALLRSLLTLPEAEIRARLHKMYLCTPRGVDLLCRFLTEEKLTDSELPLLRVLRGEGCRQMMKRMLSTRDIMLRILLIRLAGLLRIGDFRDHILSLMREHNANLNLQYAGFLTLAMTGDAEAIVGLCTEPGYTETLSYRSLKEIFSNYTGEDKRQLYERLLQSQDMYTRRIIVKNIGEEGYGGLAVRLMPMLSGTDENLQCDVVRSLGQLSYAPAGTRIAELMQTGGWTLRNAAVVALANIDARLYRPQLIAGLGDKEWWVRYNSAHALCAHVPLEELETLIPTLDDRFARDILRFAIQEARIMDKGADAQ